MWHESFRNGKNNTDETATNFLDLDLRGDVNTRHASAIAGADRRPGRFARDNEFDPSACACAKLFFSASRDQSSRTNESEE